MVLELLKKVFPSKNDREIRRLRPRAEAIAALEPKFAALSDAELTAMTAEFRDKLSHGFSLDDILEEAFAVVREAGKRTLGLRHYDVQMIGGMVLHEGKIAEMRTGEGKTLVASLPVYLNALSGKGVHVVTVNDYLARRDSLGKGDFKGMGEIYRFLGLSVGCIIHDQPPDVRHAAYMCDVTYGTNNEFGFDYLRDNMVNYAQHRVQRKLNFALVDEVDSILIDEARTPLIISGPADESTDKYGRVDALIPRMAKETHYTIDEKARSAMLTDDGVSMVEQFLGLENLYDDRNTVWVHHVQQALRAHVIYKRDIDYVVRDGKVTIVDEFTGRLMPGRRWGEGLHQAVEAKEKMAIERETQTLATITLQNYFRMYEKLAGMTGTALTEAQEFHEIYKLDVVTIPTNRPMVRADHPDLIFKNLAGKFKAVADEIAEHHKRGQPVLVGTVSIEKNEMLSEMLKRRGVRHEVLNAKNHEREAEIIALAGQTGAVTIATNMAGRGTDIQLGPGVADLGGLHVLGTERNESRRVDNQLRGRSGRQGDPGSSRFYISLEDDLMRIFGSDKLQGMMGTLGMTDDEAIEHPWINKSIERAQKSVEGHNFDIRKRLLEYDDVMNRQREVVYSRRQALLEGEDIREDVAAMVLDQAESHFALHVPAEADPSEWDLDGLDRWFEECFRQKPPHWEGEARKKLVRDEALRAYLAAAETAYKAQEDRLGAEALRVLERHIVLEAVDTAWKDHLYSMDHLKEGVGLRAYGQLDPLIEYKREGYEMFSRMMAGIKEGVVPMLLRMEAVHQEAPAPLEDPRLRQYKESRPEFTLGTPPAPGQAEAAVPVGVNRPAATTAPAPPPQTVRRKFPKVGRNEPCPCGSGKKYKHCHGNANEGS
ncbi:MAG TPA: preprotein translocase subunit SecA [bacterium]|nr:preprotein translocase subunit SecA [bacterium]